MHRFSSDDIQLLSIISEGLGPALKNAELYCALREQTRQLAVLNKELVTGQRELVGKARELREAGQPSFLSNPAQSMPNRSKTAKRSPYECFNAKVKGDKIYCAKGHSFQLKAPELHIRRLERGAPLISSICQECRDFDWMGPPLPKEERGYPHLAGH